MTNTEIPQDKLAGSVYGLAYGDAVGAPVEFKKYDELREIYKNGYVTPKYLDITDDTQMSLYVWSALNEWDGKSLGMLRLELRVAFQAYYDDPDNDWKRAPGMTVMSALGRSEQMGFGGWAMASSPSSAGCGSVMRAAWVGLHPKVTDENLFAVAAMQATLTHGPAENAFCAAALAALTRAIARGEIAPGDGAKFISNWADDHDGMAYDRDVLGQLWALTIKSDFPKDQHADRLSYVAEGLEHVRWVAEAADALTYEYAVDPPLSFDPQEVTGGGWRCREAVAMAVGIFDANLSPVMSIKTAAFTSGDSDSTAAITGALVGAYAGNLWPVEWEDKLESRYKNELAVVSEGRELIMVPMPKPVWSAPKHAKKTKAQKKAEKKAARNASKKSPEPTGITADMEDAAVMERVDKYLADMGWA